MMTLFGCAQFFKFVSLLVYPMEVMLQSFVPTVPPPMGMGRDSDFSLFRALV